MLTVAAKDPRIAAVVSQCPFTDGFASLPKMGPTNVVKASVAGLRDQLGALVGRPAQGHPRGWERAVSDQTEFLSCHLVSGRGHP